MGRELSSDEKNFVNETLSAHSDLDLEVDEATKVAKIVKTKRMKVPGYKSPFRWFIALASLPVLLVGAFFVLLMRAEAYLGGRETLQFLVENNNGDTGEMIAQVAEQAGQGWLPDFLIVYEYRMPIIIGVVIIFLAMLLIYTLVDNWKYNKQKKRDAANQKVEEDAETNSSVINNNEEGEIVNG